MALLSIIWPAWLLVAAASEAGSCDADALAASAASFRRDGFAVLPHFANASQISSMLSSMETMVAAWWGDERARDGREENVFVTGEKQTSAQAASRYFFDSADRVHFFREAGATADGDRPPELNKVGHGLHLNESTPFGAYAASAEVAAVARTVAGLESPVLPQSMYIFKGAGIGGVVTSHQDGTFLYTRPRQTVVGLWLALHDAHTGNGCLWARPGSHREPLRRRFVRTGGGDKEVVMTFVDESVPATDEAYFFAASGAVRRTPWQRARRWLVALRRWLLRRPASASSAAAPDERAVHAARSEQARTWEGHWPADDADNAAAAAELAARGFVPLNVSAGDLVVLAGTLDHLSLPNHSPRDRHTFQLHMIEGPAAGVQWAPENWLQYSTGSFQSL